MLFVSQDYDYDPGLYTGQYQQQEAFYLQRLDSFYLSILFCQGAIFFSKKHILKGFGKLYLHVDPSLLYGHNTAFDAA